MARARVGYACAYTPLAVIEAAGFTPHRILPMGQVPDRAGQVLHDNLCRHVKLVLDRAVAGDMPDLSGLVLMSSCDAMRRLRDAWVDQCPDIPCTLVELPGSASPKSERFFEGQIQNLAATLRSWGGQPVETSNLSRLVGEYNKAADLFRQLERAVAGGLLVGGASQLQKLYNKACTLPVKDAVLLLENAACQPTQEPTPATPMFLFGNVLPDPDAMGLFEQCGVRIVGADMCTGSRAFTSVQGAFDGDPTAALARGLLGKAPCARTLSDTGPGALAAHVVEQAQATGAAGVICHTLKFCDPYLFRIPRVQDELRKAGVPMLVLEGDCTLGSLGQQRTRIEAFVETLEGTDVA